MNKPIFRNDIKSITFEDPKRGPRYLLTRPEDGASMEVGIREYFILRRLDGRATPEEIQAEYLREFSAPLETFFLETVAAEAARRGFLVSSDPTKRPVSSRPRKRFRLGNPQAFFIRLHGLFRWCFQKVWVAAWAALWIPFAGIAFSNWESIGLQAQPLWDVTSPANLALFLIISLFGVRIPHELAHGLALVHYGGRVSECGFRFHFKLIPVFYCDIREILWLSPKRRRLVVRFAGLFCQLTAVQTGLFGWWLASESPNLGRLFLTLAAAGTFSFLFNMTSLMSGDGYLLLTDALGIPDLRHRAIRRLRSVFFPWRSCSPPAPREGWGILLGILMAAPAALIPYLAWRAGAQLTGEFQGVGALILGAGAVMGFQEARRDVPDPAAPAHRHQRLLFGKGRRRLIHAGLLLAFLALMLVPYPYDTGGPINLLSDRRVGIRPQVFGEVEQVLIQENDWVRPGQTVALLSTRIHQKQLDVSQAELEATRARLQLLKAGPTPETIGKTEQEVKTFEVQHDYFRKETDRLQPLFERGVISEERYQEVKQRRDLNQQKLDEARANLRRVKAGFRGEDIEAMEAEVRRLESQVARYREDVQLTALSSPIEGRITTPYIQDRVGYYLKEGDLFAQVENTRTLQAEVEIPEGNIGDVKVGSPARIKVWAFPSRRFEGKVISIAPIAVDKGGSRVVRVLIQIPNEGEQLKSGLTGYAKIEAEWKPIGVILTRLVVRFFLVEVWYWIP